MFEFSFFKTLSKTRVFSLSSWPFLTAMPLAILLAISESYKQKCPFFAGIYAVPKNGAQYGSRTRSCSVHSRVCSPFHQLRHGLINIRACAPMRKRIHFLSSRIPSRRISSFAKSKAGNSLCFTSLATSVSSWRWYRPMASSMGTYRVSLIYWSPFEAK